MLAMCLTMSFPSFSQDTTKIKVKKSTLIKIKKDLDKCDSLRVAYDNQVNTLNDLVQLNLEYYNMIEANVKIQQNLQLQLDQSVKALRKKKRGNWILPTTIGVVGGLVGGVIIAK